ncbi:MAG: hypothetical protein HRT37_03310 [Alteromonadaceae bacterium]|nr:hypothetical protein [Alteromonadaceae bacterium]
MAAETEFNDVIPKQHNAFIYLISGELKIGQQQTKLTAGQLAVLTSGEKIKFNSNNKAQLLLVAGKPLNEPVVRAGPFVMNTRQEINQAINDYQNGKFVTT